MQALVLTFGIFCVPVFTAGHESDNIRRPQISTLQSFQRTASDSTIFADTVRENSESYSSDNYPGMYPVGTKTFSISFENSTGLDILVSDLDIDPLEDSLKLTPSDRNGVKGKSYILTGNLLSTPLKLRALGFPNLDIVFDAQTTKDNYRGYRFTAIPYGDVPPPPAPPNDFRPADDDIETISKFIKVKEIDQNIGTWNRFREIICSATNAYATKRNSILETCDADQHSRNVTFPRIGKCPSEWLDNGNCVEMRFTVTLYNNRSRMPNDIDSYLQSMTPRYQAGLNRTELEEMWRQFGHEYFANSGFDEYETLDNRAEICMWIGIALGTLVLIVCILVAILRMPVFRDRWIEEEKIPASDDLETQKPEDDITMYVTSPDQIMPDLYPAALNSNYSHDESTYAGIGDMFRTMIPLKEGFSKLTEAVIEEESGQTQELTEELNFRTAGHGSQKRHSAVEMKELATTVA